VSSQEFIEKSSSARRPTTDERAPGVFSIDLEDFSQLTCRDATGVVPPPSPELDRQMDVLLELLSEEGVRGTFFTLGMLAEHRPDIVRRVHAAGHEIASHGTQHIQAFRQSRQEFKQDVDDSLRRLTDLIGEPVRGYRAPIFSITSENLWALDVLAELGVEYDSSIFPMRTRRYGIDGFDPRPRVYTLPEGGRLTEIPLVTWERGGRHYPVAGGGYLRLLPARVIEWAVGDIRRSGQCFTLYLHPYEFDPGRLDVARSFAPDRPMPRLRRGLLNWKWNLGRASIVPKVRRMCRMMTFATYGELARATSEREAPRPLARADAARAGGG
jgi:polysaccharide deacetylase family protein (PEP-CTERM system associated)